METNHPPYHIIMIRTIIVGLGNPILGDDGVGWRVAEEISHQLPEKHLMFPNIQSNVEKHSLGGLSLMEVLIDYDIAIIIDALNTGKYPVGTVRCFPIEELTDQGTSYSTSVHDTSLQNAIKVGKLMGAKLPKEILIIGIEAEKLYEFSENLSPEVNSAIPQACQFVWEYLEKLEKTYDLT